MYALGNPVCLGMFPGQNGAREKPHGLPVSVMAFSLPIQTVTGDWQTCGISGDPRSTVDAWFCCVGNSTSIFCTDWCSEQEQCATSRDFVTVWHQKGESVVSESVISGRSAHCCEHLCWSYGEPHELFCPEDYTVKQVALLSLDK